MANNYARYNTNAANTVCGQACTLHSVSINTKGATANTLTLADGVNTIAVIDTTAGPSFYLYDVACLTNLKATLAAGTAADVTIAFA